MKTKDIKEEILRRTDNGRLVFEHYSGCDRAHKNFLNPEYHDTKPSCNFFFSHSRPICTKNMAVTSPMTASVLSLAVSTWTAKRSSV